MRPVRLLANIPIILLLATFPLCARSQTLSPEKLALVKRATVFISTPKGEGTGFLFENNRTEGLVATAAHVVADIDANDAIQIFFNSGTQEEVFLKAEIVGMDEERDIAFLQVRSTSLPEPIYLQPRASVQETMDVFVAGFPFGGMMAIGRRRPSLTISRGAISSIKQDVIDDVAVLQMDVSVNPGNSGGPVITSRGEVIGVVSSKIDGTQLTFAIPTAAVFADLQGRSTDVRATKTVVKGANETYEIDGRLVDPLQHVESLSASFFSIVSVPSLDLRSAKDWQKIPSVHQESLSKAGGSFSGLVTLPIKGMKISETGVQIVCHRKDGTVHYSVPYPMERILSKSKSNSKTPNKPKQPNDREPSIPPNRPRQPLTSNVVKTEKLARFEFDAMGSTNRSAISEPVDFVESQITRVFVNYSTPVIAWDQTGENLMLVGKHMTKVDFPKAAHIRAYLLPDKGEHTAFLPDQLVTQIARNQLGIFDPKTMQIHSEIRFSHPIHMVGSTRADSWLVSEDVPASPAIYHCNTKGMSPNPLDFSQKGTKETPKLVFVAENGGLIFTLDEERISRFSIEERTAHFQESAPFSKEPSDPNSNLNLAFLNGGDENWIAVAQRSYGLSFIRIYRSTDLSEQYSLSVPIWVNCMCVDKRRDRVILGSTDGLWGYFLKEKALKSIPFPKSAPSIEGLAMHPDGKTLALSCSAGVTHFRLYWMEFE